MVNYASERRRRGQGSGVAASLAHSVPRRRPSAPLGPSLPPCPNGGHPSAHPSTVTDRSIDRSDTLFDSRFACVFLAARLWSLSVLLSFSWPELRGSARTEGTSSPAQPAFTVFGGLGWGNRKGSFLPCCGRVSPPGVSVGGHSVAPEKVKTPRGRERAS